MTRTASEFFTMEDKDASYRDAMFVPCITIERANAIFREWIEKTPEVFHGGTDIGQGWLELAEYHALCDCPYKHTHRGRVVFIEELK